MCTEGMQGEPFQSVKAPRDTRRKVGRTGRTQRLEPWHLEGQPTCRAKPLGIDTAPSMINRAVTYDKCSTVYVTYFKIAETQRYSFFCSSFIPPVSPYVKGGPTTPSITPLSPAFLFLLEFCQRPCLYLGL